MSELQRKIKQAVDSPLAVWRKQILLPVHDEVTVEMVNPPPSAAGTRTSTSW